MCGQVKMDGVARPRYYGDGKYRLYRDGQFLRRQRQFRKQEWKTLEGAQRAADALNARLTAQAA